jgi:hypothetical protein
MSFETTALLVTWVAILLLAFVVAGLVRQVHGLTSGRPRAAPLGLPVGAAAPGLTDIAPVGRPTVVLFLEESCSTCTEVLHEMVTFRQSHRAASGARTVAVFRGDAPAMDRNDREAPVLTSRDDLFDQYRIPVTPFVVVVDEEGRIRVSEPIGSAVALRTHLEQWGSTPELSTQH